MKLLEGLRDVKDFTYQSNLQIYSAEASVHWSVVVWRAEIDDEAKSIISLYELLPGTIRVNYLNRTQGRVTKSLFALRQEDTATFNRITPTSNCHGFTLANNQYWIDDRDADILLRNEYREVPVDELANHKQYITAFYENDKLVHSSIYSNNEHRHKMGVTLEESFPNYAGLPACYINLPRKYFIRNPNI